MAILKVALMAKKLYEEKKRTPFANRLQNAAKGWGELTRPMRKCTQRMLAHYAGGWYSGGTSGEITSESSYLGFRDNSSSQPINLIDRGVSIIGPYLVSHNPKVLVDPKRDMPKLRPFGRTMELALEHLFEEIQFAQNTLRPVVINSLFSMGISKTSVMYDHSVEILGYLHDVGMPYSDSIEFNDYIGDISARNRQEMSLEGHFYYLDEEYVKTSGMFKNAGDLTPIEAGFNNEDTSPDKIAKINPQYSPDQLRSQVRLMDIWLPDQGIIMTLPPPDGGSKVLRKVTWDGPESGPLDILAYKYFPNSVIPIPPVYTWLDLNNLLNTLVSKMNEQAQREKKVALYELGGSEDMQAVLEAPDGGTAGVRNPESIREVEYGGINPLSFSFVQYLEQQYSITGGNLYTLGGRDTQAETLGQEQMLQANASKQLEDMIQQLHLFTKRIVKKLAWFLWTDPYIKLPLIRRIGNLTLEDEYSAEAREGDFVDFGFDIEPYSMSKMSPEMKYQRFMQLISQVVLPTAQIAASQGSSLNVTGVVKEAARYLDIRNIDSWWDAGVPSEFEMNPYQPTQGTKGSGQGDGRMFKEGGSDTASNLNNLLAQQTRAGGQSTGSGAGATTKGM